MHTLEELLLAPRHTHGRIVLNGLAISYQDPLSLYHQYRDIFQREIYHFRAAGRSPVILDAGGYIGLSAMYFKSLYPGARITVFEPDPSVIPLLKANLEENGFSDVTVIPAGIGKAEATVPFFSDGADGGTTVTFGSTSGMEVEQVRLSRFLTGSVDMLKMNIEGIEGEVIEEIESRLPNIGEIIFEYHSFSCMPQRLGDILVRLDRQGFRYLVAEVPGVPVRLPFQLGRQYKHFNLVYAKNWNWNLTR